jgi:hypothetical protein
MIFPIKIEPPRFFTEAARYLLSVLFNIVQRVFVAVSGSDFKVEVVSG